MKHVIAFIFGLLLALSVATNSASANETVTYTYDVLGRLVAISTSGTAPTDGQSVNTQFDPAGNRTGYTVNGAVPLPAVTVIASAGTVTEGQALTFNVALSAAATWAVTVNYSTANGTATGGSDYTAANGVPITFSPGMTSQTVSVATSIDQTPEQTETLQLNLVAASGATIGTPMSAAGNILDRKPKFVVVPLNGYTLIQIDP